jgi:heptaprenylglyceryl phosphate synthase
MVRLTGRRLAILADREKPEYIKILKECIRLKEFLADRNVEYWSGGTGTSKSEMEMMIEDFNNAGLRPTVCFPSLPTHAWSAKNADCLFRPYLANTSGAMGLIAQLFVLAGRSSSNYLNSHGYYSKEIEIRDSIYLILDGSTSVGKATGARTITDDRVAKSLFIKELLKHPDAHGYGEGGSKTEKSPIYLRTELIEKMDILLPPEKTLHLGGNITEVSHIQTIDDRINRKNYVIVIGNYFERRPERIKGFASLFPK